MPIRDPTLVLFIGDGGVGKSTLITKLARRYPAQFAVVRACTTRPLRTGARGALDRLIYRHVSDAWMEEEFAAGGIAVLTRRSFGMYGTHNADLAAAINGRHGLLSIAPSLIDEHAALGYPTLVVRVVATDRRIDRRDQARRAFDAREAAIPPKVHLTIENSFARGALHHTVTRLHEGILHLTNT